MWCGHLARAEDPAAAWIGLAKGVSVRKGKSVGVCRLCLAVRTETVGLGRMETEDAG